MGRHASVTQTAPAKLNLSLHVLRRRADGYHELDSLVAFVPDLSDRLRLAPTPAATKNTLMVHGPFAAAVPTDGRNLALRAANEMLRRWPDLFAPVHIELRKALPVAAGIGGGSADAAAVLRGLCALYRAHPPEADLRALALELGADVPVCLSGRAARVGGIGEMIRPVRLPSTLHVLLCNPGIAISTAAVFRRLAELRRAEKVREAPGMAPRCMNFASIADFIDALEAMRNDLERPACERAPQVGECLRALRALPGARLVRMSGSGATCFALFESGAGARAAEDRLRRKHPDWWVGVGVAI